LITFQSFGEDAKLTDGNGNQKTFIHNADGNVMNITEGGYTTNFSYVKKGEINQGLLEKVIYHRKNFTQYTYKGETNLVQYVTENPGPIGIDDPAEAERVTVFNYEDFSPNLKSIVYPGGLTQHYSYNDYGQLTSEYTTFDNTRIGMRQTYDYHPESNPGGTGSSESPRMLNPTTGGYLKCSTSSFGDFLDNETWNNWDNYTYDKRGNLDTVISSDGIYAIYKVNDYDEVWYESITSTFKESLSPLSYEGNYTYYDNGNIWTSTTQSGSLSRSNTYTYDLRYNLLTDIDSIRGITAYTYDNNDNMLSVSGPSGNIGFIYTGRDLVETVTIGSDTHTFSYDGYGNVSTFTDPFNRVTTYSYDGYDRLKSVNDALSNQTIFSRFNYGNGFNIKSYNSTGDLLRETIRINDPLGRMTSYTVTMPDGDNINYTITYENEGRTVTITDPLGRESKVYKNEYGRVWKEEDAAGNITEYFYEDGRGNMTKKVESVKSADGAVTETYETEYIYNAHNKIEMITEKMVDSDDLITEFYYDQMGNLTGTKDAEGNKITHEYDSLGRRVKTIKHFNDGQDITTEFTWYPSNNIHTIKDAKGNITEYQYDSQNRTKKIIYPDDTFIEYTYDKVEAGQNQNNETLYYRLVIEKQRNGTVVKHFYDQLQRLMKREVISAEGVEGTTLETLEYDGLSRVTKATDDDSEVEFGYDRANRLKWEKQIGKLIEYTYDKVNNVKSIKYPNTRLIERDFDQLNRMNIIKEGSVNIAEMTHIGRSYRLLNKQYGNGDLINYLYDHGRRLTSKVTKNKNEDLINKYVYGYNKVHMKMFEQRVHDSDKGDIFGYDEIYRLKHVKFNSPEPTNPETSLFEKSKTINFDKLHNIMSIVETQNQTTNEIFTTIEGENAKLNQYTTFDQWGLDYDLNGNTIQKGIQKFYYDYRNQLVRVTEGGATTAEYKYDALGRRFSKQLPNSSTHPLTSYYHAGNQVIEERDGSDNVLKQYIYGNGIDEVIRVDINDSGNFTPYYFHTNGIGSVTAITDQNGQLVERISYDLYGMPTFTDYKTDPQNPQVVGSSVIGNELLFQGRRFEKETNLVYFRARYFDPIMGRFLSVDPMGYQDSMNLYQAFWMNPVNFVDPLGLIIKIDESLNSRNQRRVLRSLILLVKTETGRELYRFLNNDSRIYTITFGDTAGGHFELENINSNKDDFTSAKIVIGWSTIRSGAETFKEEGQHIFEDYLNFADNENLSIYDDLKTFKMFKGLKNKYYMVAEVIGHEMKHAVEAMYNHKFSVERHIFFDKYKKIRNPYLISGQLSLFNTQHPQLQKDYEKYTRLVNFEEVLKAYPTEMKVYNELKRVSLTRKERKNIMRLYKAMGNKIFENNFFEKLVSR
jgi:RHS repeat-associated protein